MKKQEFTSIPLKLKKVNIANLMIVGGAYNTVSAESNCCSAFPLCQHTVTTRPDSFVPAENKRNTLG